MEFVGQLLHKNIIFLEFFFEFCSYKKMEFLEVVGHIRASSFPLSVIRDDDLLLTKIGRFGFVSE